MFHLRSSSQRLLTTVSSVRSKHTLPVLPYAYDALEPVISAQIMEIHHSKHHQAYVNGLNAAEEKYKEAAEKGDVRGMIGQHDALRFNGGGHINHSIFWSNLGPIHAGGTGQEGLEGERDVVKILERDYGSLEAFQKLFNAKSAAVQGSGWGWLVWSPELNKTQIITRPNQDPLSPDLIPLLGIDVWEHAYYLQYKNVRPEYLNQIWKVINWKTVAKRLADAQQLK